MAGFLSRVQGPFGGHEPAAASCAAGRAVTLVVDPVGGDPVGVGSGWVDPVGVGSGWVDPVGVGDPTVTGARRCVVGATWPSQGRGDQGGGLPAAADPGVGEGVDAGGSFE